MDGNILAIVIFGLLGFVLTHFFIYKFRSFARSINLVGKDINKKNAPEVEESFGVPVFFALTTAIVFYAIVSYLYVVVIKTDVLLFYLLGLGMMVLIGFLEDLTALRRDKYKKEGFHQKYKILLPLIPSFPLIYASLDRDTITLPLLGTLDLGLIYPLVLVPIGIIGASNATNMLAGLNGLEALLGIITISTLGVYGYFIGKEIVFIISLFFVITLIAFYMWNKYPAKIFPGDSLNYAIGYTIASLSILEDMEWFAVSIFILWFIELILKARSKFKAESFGKVNRFGGLEKPYDKIYSLTHIFMNGRLKEPHIVYIIALIQLLICGLSLYLFLA